MSWQYAMMVTADYVANVGRAVHIDELMFRTVIGRMYVRKGYVCVLNKHVDAYGLSFDGQFVSDNRGFLASTL